MFEEQIECVLCIMRRSVLCDSLVGNIVSLAMHVRVLKKYIIVYDIDVYDVFDMKFDFNIDC